MSLVKKNCNFVPILPTVYGEALSYMEMLRRVIDAINALTVAFNDGLSAEINQWIAANYNELLLNAVYDKDTETITLSKDDSGSGIIQGGNFERVADFVTDSAGKSIDVPLDTPITAFTVTVTIPPEPDLTHGRVVYVGKRVSASEALCQSSRIISSRTGETVYQFICFPIGNKLLSFSITALAATKGQTANLQAVVNDSGLVDAGPIDSLTVFTFDADFPAGTMVKVDAVKLRAEV